MTLYDIPNTWRWTTLENISDVIMGQSPSGDETTSDSTYIPLIGGAADMGNLFPVITRYTKVPTKLSKKDDVIICVRATLGRPIYSDGVYCLGRGVAAIRSNVLIKEYIRYFMINNEQYLYENATGSTFLQITSTKLKSMPVPLPPLDEQQRIVDIIESLFAKLDKAKILAQNVIDKYELRRSAILHKAFTGELTNSNLDDWQRTKLGNVCNFIGGGTPSKKSPDYWNGNVSWASVKDVKGDYLYNTIDKITEAGLKNSSSNLCEIGDLILVTRMAPGKTIIAKIITAINQDLKIIKSDLCIKFLHYFFENIRDKIEMKSSGTTVKGIKIDTLNEFEIFIPNIDEQKEIVRILDSLLAKEQRTKELAKQVLQKIDLIKKSILARAFRGEFE